MWEGDAAGGGGGTTTTGGSMVTIADVGVAALE
jgi:hypothetical protein